MILGRPTNLWTGLAAAVIGFLSIVGVSVLGWDPTIVAQVGGAAGLLLGAAIALIANQAPVVTPGSSVTVQTPSGQPNATATLDISKAGDVVVS